jgi:hypothetical protein
MGATVVHGVDPAIMEEERKRVTGDPDGEAPFGAHIL